MPLSAVRGDELQGGGGGGGEGREECAYVCARGRDAGALVSGKQVGRRGEAARGETEHQDDEGGQEEERESASAADRHRRTAEPDAQVSLQIFPSSVQQKILCMRTLFCEYANLNYSLTTGCGCTFYEIEDSLCRGIPVDLVEVSNLSVVPTLVQHKQTKCLYF